METIRRLDSIPQPDRMAAQEAAILAVETRNDALKAEYRELDGAFGGRYVGADLAKELFPVYRQSNEARNRYNNVVHNAAAVLASSLYDDAINRASDGQTQAVFLTGSPGAGKTSLVVHGGALDGSIAVVYEGQMWNIDNAAPKLQKALDAGLVPEIKVVHPQPEQALENTFRRFNEVGRGASIGVMARIQGSMHDGLAEVHSRFGDKVSLTIIDYADGQTPTVRSGWNELGALKSAGDKDAIQARLLSHLQRHRAAGTITDECYRQAAGEGLAAANLAIRAMVPEAGRGMEQDAVRSRSFSSPQAAQLLISQAASKPNLTPGELARAHYFARQDESWSVDFEKRHGPRIAAFSNDLARKHGEELAQTFKTKGPVEGSRRHPELANAYALAHQAALKTQHGDSAILARFREKISESLRDNVQLPEAQLRKEASHVRNREPGISR